MTIVEFFYFILSIGFAVTVVFVSYAAFQIGATLRTLKRILEDVEDATYDIRSIKNFFKWKLLRFMKRVLEFFD